MPKYRVTVSTNAQWEVGTYKADSEEDAIDKSGDDNNSGWHQSLCHQCASKIDLGEPDVDSMEAEQVEE